MKKDNSRIPFNVPHMTGKELNYIAQAHFNGMLAGDGPFTKSCHDWLQMRTNAKKALLTNSCTAALEMAALLLDIAPGDEVIMPSFTFVSTANAFVLRGAVPVFVDIRLDTLNIDERLIEDAITSRTKAIAVVHYAGVSCEMDIIMDIAARRGLFVVEDAAQGVMSSYKGRPLGSIGDLGAYSFHETKNVISGEGGALIVNREDFAVQSEIIREKGTDRTRFFRGEVDKYTWQSIGSSFLPGELIAAFLWAQLEEAEAITNKRLVSWQVYDKLIEPLEVAGAIRRPIVPAECTHNAHMYYVLVSPDTDRQAVLNEFRRQSIATVFHYIPLHSSPAGIRYGRVHGSMEVTTTQSERLIRLPLWFGITSEQQREIVGILSKTLGMQP
ncbi:dTDP-4-amino-4,6-dideoxygalactose transaminase [Rhodoferax aquaticus]|uniref:dTDP-4-amino-4,6-dideoxygalactose transaminase n=1 Tax=Rhodoferax aquaticus TaxID=2527691 RepID=A0A515EP48_9BURK|nr:dTDP-4-amino-4,6-dideoxygalactose transaminase [Rhodoferax aquaticus]QDL54442.1 dTDP-4-amino-4,6-dideoxygalactose transaminase [Rhodoferax aquaticus]